MKVPRVSAAVGVTLAGRPTFKAVVTRAHEYSGTIEIGLTAQEKADIVAFLRVL
jgi:hypothetical protein